MNLKHLTDAALLQSTDRVVRAEREILAQVLHHLHEIDRRKLFCDGGFTSLYDYTTRHLKYSNDQAQRRIAAMRLLREMPKLEQEVEAGNLNLTQLGMAKAAFTRQAFAPAEKEKLFEEIKGKSSRETETIILSAAPLPEKPEKIRAASESTVRIEFTAPNSLEEKILRLKGMLAHANPGLSTAELFEKLCDLGLEHFSKEEKSAAPRESQAAVRREVFTKAESRCENCRSYFAPEVDHRIPKAVGGSNGIANSRLLCHHCNQRAARRFFGVDKIQMHISKRQQPR